MLTKDMYEFKRLIQNIQRSTTLPSENEMITGQYDNIKNLTVEDLEGDELKILNQLK